MPSLASRHVGHLDDVIEHTFDPGRELARFEHALPSPHGRAIETTVHELQSKWPRTTVRRRIVHDRRGADASDQAGKGHDVEDVDQQTDSTDDRAVAHLASTGVEVQARAGMSAGELAVAAAGAA